MLWHSIPLTPFDKGGIEPYLYDMQISSTPLKIGILGGGQLGRMLLQAAANYPVETFILENDADCPAAHLCHHFTVGDIKDFASVYNFGKHLDALTIEIENVNVEALEKLEAEGVKIFPKPSVLKTIKNKILQKEFYRANQIPSAGFIITSGKKEFLENIDFLPAVQKLAEGGYDGRGVQILKSKEETDKAFDAPSVLEKLIDLEKEIAVIVAINDKGATAVYPAVEMIFDAAINQLDHQVCPADIETTTAKKAAALALAVAKNLHSPGLFAIEMFITKSGEVLVNETAPRVHNSGHHTIEAHYCSQFDMLWRIMLNYPLGNTNSILPSIMINIVGKQGDSGEAIYSGMEKVLELNNAFVHIYGKKQTKPGRKMGHITVMGNDKPELIRQANQIKRILRSKNK